MDSSQNICVGIVDDDDSIRRALTRLLRAARFQPITYPSAEAFLADANRPKFVCLVLDIQLGGLSGLDLSRRLSAVKDGTPVIFNTAHDDPELRAQAKASGCAGFFRKTDPAAHLLAAIRRATKLEDSNAARQPGEKNRPG
jgi:FixJ family two-component response regulator